MGKIDDLLARFSLTYRLSPREMSLLSCALGGQNNDEAAANLGCSRATVASFWNRIFAKVGRHNQRDVMCMLVSLALEEPALPRGQVDASVGNDQIGVAVKQRLLMRTKGARDASIRSSRQRR